MYVVFLAGGIASGKSTVARELERLGAWRIDLDRVSREVLEPGGECTQAIAREFGDDLLDPTTGQLRRGLLARRAFATDEGATRLEQIELPYIRRRLEEVLGDDGCTDAAGAPRVAVVEVPLLDRMEDALDLADEVVCVTCPLVVRRVRAQGRGMDPEDFDARARRQPTDDYLRSKADVELANEGDEKDLLRQVDAWWQAHEADGWKTRRG
ncbi:MAG: dephospho-CoA kinase [Olsenella sp.]|nr:dephospho-CoA kinase [Olsenella sp.]